MKTVALVLIVWNEEEGLKAILPRIDLRLFDEVLAVDGCSHDGTQEVLKQWGIATYQQQGPGLGQAMLDARSYVTSDAFVFFHPDGNEDPADLPRMVEMLRGGAEFVVASRMTKDARNEEDHLTFRWRKWANQGFAFLANLFFARGTNRTTDVTNGFRGIRCAAWDGMRLTSTDLTMDYQMVIRALKTGTRITEFPTTEGERVAGVSAFPSLSTGWAELKLLLREIAIGRRTIEENRRPGRQTHEGGAVRTRRSTAKRRWRS